MWTFLATLGILGLAVVVCAYKASPKDDWVDRYELIPKRRNRWWR